MDSGRCVFALLHSNVFFFRTEQKNVVILRQELLDQKEVLNSVEEKFRETVES